VFGKDHIRALAQAAKAAGRPARVHIKVETGSNRMGVRMDELVEFARFIQKQKLLEIEGLATHFANIEDTTDHTFAELQLRRFQDAADMVEAAGIRVPIKHCANSAATILFPKTHFQMVRLGIAGYGMWPSNETYVSFVKERKNNFQLAPAFTWKTRIAQLKTVPAGEFVGYGCTYKTSTQHGLPSSPWGITTAMTAALQAAMCSSAAGGPPSAAESAWTCLWPR
jgi:alanine racemase